MPRTIAWTSAGELATILAGERDALERQIAALIQSCDLNDQTARLQILLCKYLVEGSAKRAVDWATEMGWRRDSSDHGKPTTRNWQPNDLYAAIEAGDTGLTADLAALCDRVFSKNQVKSYRAWS